MLSCSSDIIWPILYFPPIWYNPLAYMRKSQENEVTILRRTLSFVLSVLLLIGLFLTPGEAQGATLSSKAGAVTTTASRLNVRSSASTGAGIVASLKKGSYVTLLSRSGSWWHVEYAKGQYGYCHADYITIVEGTPVTVMTNGGSLNVRSGAGTSYSRVASLSNGEAVIRLSTSGGWSRILYHGTKTGYVSAQYLSSSASAGYSPVFLGVPSFKQTDSRWASMQIGSSGKTMAQIGCATTAIAMMESYRQGKTITPDAMAKKLKYTSTGSVYWPADYTVVTSSAGYLSGVYTQLKQGKPVLFGAKNAYGSQHWVVITGYTGGNSLTASVFSIHDPGSNSRTNLQQFLNAYPACYKYFHY